MRPLILVLTLVAGFSASAADKPAAAKAESKPAADDGSKPLALPDSTLVDRYQGSSDRKISQICTSKDGRTFKQGEKGYDDCLAGVNGQMMHVSPNDPRAMRQDPLQKKDAAGVSFQLGK